MFSCLNNEEQLYNFKHEYVIEMTRDRLKHVSGCFQTRMLSYYFLMINLNF